MVFVQRVLNSVQVSLMRPLCIENCILVLKYVLTFNTSLLLHIITPDISCGSCSVWFQNQAIFIITEINRKIKWLASLHVCAGWPGSILLVRGNLWRHGQVVNASEQEPSHLMLGTGWF